MGTAGMDCRRHVASAGALAVAASLAAFFIVGAGCATSQRRVSTRRPTATLASDPAWRSSLRQRALEFLKEAAFDDSAMLRANAIEGLQEVPDEVEPLARLGLRDENLGVRSVAAMTIGQLQLSESAVFVEPLLSDPSLVVQAAAIYALRRNGVQADPTPLAAMLGSNDSTQRAQGAFTLGELGDASAIKLLRSAARRSLPLASRIKDRLVRLQIAEALVKLGDTGAIETIRAALFPSRPEDLEAAALAVQIIGNVNDQRSIDQLIYLTARGGRDRLPAEIRLAASLSLAKLGNRRGFFIADEYLRDPNPAIRAQAAFVLGATNDLANLEKLDQLLSDPEGMVRVASASAILRALERGVWTASVDTHD